MTKWNKKTFIESLRENCSPHVLNISMDFIKFAEVDADIVSWGRGTSAGTMTYKVKSEDWGIVSLFHTTTDGKIKFLLNLIRHKVRKREIIRDYALKLECNFMLDFEEDVYTSDIYFDIEELFHTYSDFTKFKQTITSISARLHQ